MRSSAAPGWGVVADLWECDGSLRDVYVLDTELADWSALMVWATANFEHQYRVDGELAALPAELGVLLNHPTTQSLRVRVGVVDLHCHFFCSQQIEFDIDPGQVQGAEQHHVVLGFLKGLAEALIKPVLLTPENGCENPMLKYEPESGLWSAFPPDSP